MAPPHAIILYQETDVQLGHLQEPVSKKEYIHYEGFSNNGVILISAITTSRQNKKKKSTLEAQKTLLLRTLCKEASDVSAFVMDVKRLMETSIKHNRINVPLDHLGANKVWASKKIQHKSQLVI